MKRPFIIVIALLLLIPALLLAWLTLTEAGLQWAYLQAKPFLPADLSINKLEGKLFGPITITDLQYAQQDTLIKTRQLIVDWQPTALLLTQININQLHIQSLNIALPGTDNTQPSQKQNLNLPSINFPWRIALNNVLINDINISQNNQTYGAKQIKLNASSLLNKINIEELNIHNDNYNIHILGELRLSHNYRHNLNINWQVELPSKSLVKGKGAIKGNLNSSHIKQQLSGPIQLTLDAKLNNVLKDLNWQAKIDASHFDSSKLHADWPALNGAFKLQAKGDLNTAVLTGNLDGHHTELGNVNAVINLKRLSNNSIQIDQLKLQAPINNTQLTASGLWMPAKGGGDVNLNLNWQNLRWPAQHASWFNSTQGQASIEGNIERYKIQLSTDSPWPQTVPSSWNVLAEGDLESLNFHSLRVKILKGEINATGKLNWRSGLSWKTDIHANDINPASLWPQWPGLLKADVTNTGTFINDKLITDLKIDKLNGTLRNFPISLHSQLGLRDNELDIEFFDFQSGDSQVSVSGHAGKSLKLDWSIATTNLAELYPQAQGKLQAKGQLSGLRDTPEIKASIIANDLKLKNNELGSIEGTLNIDLFKWKQLDIQLAAQAIKLNEYELQSLNINASSQKVQAKAISKILTTQVELKGHPQEKGWSGTVERIDIMSTQFDNWQLASPVMLNISEKSLLTDNLCLHNAKQARFCMSVIGENKKWRSSMDLQNFPLLILGPWLSEDLKFDGLVNATAKLTHQIPDQTQGNIHIDLPAGTVTSSLLEDEQGRWEYRKGIIDVTLDNQQIKAQAEMAMKNGDHLQASIKLPEAKLLSLDPYQQRIQANIQSNIRGLGLIETLLPEVQQLRGTLKINLDIDGTLAQPNFYGQANLLNTSLHVPRLGLTINELNLKSQIKSEGKSQGKSDAKSDGKGQRKNQEKLNFQLNAHSGDGKLSIVGHTTMDRSAGWPTEIYINGHQFEVSNIPEARVHISPDLQIKLKHRTIDIKGKVHIPYAKLQPKDFSTAAKVSDDAVIIGEEQAVEDKWSIFTRTRVTLGERVNFYGFGFDGRFEGSLLLEDEPGQLTKATGELNIPEGRYRAYGQRLDVEHGRLLYTGGPLSNPGLNIRAVRHTNDITAGLRVKGSLSQPQLELFSIPAMGQTDALSYLVLGRPMENNSKEESSTMAKAALALSLSGGDYFARVVGDRFGLDEMRVESSDSGDQASLVVGRYLSPKLYVSYGVGLIEAINTLSVRYQLTDHWQLKAESGESQGADIFYTIER